MIQAIDTKAEDQENYIDSLIQLAALEKHKSVVFCKKAIEILKKKESYLEIELIKLKGELAIAYWFSNEINKSLESFEDAVSRLFIERQKGIDNDWMRTFSLIGHCTGYFSAEVLSNRLIESTKDGAPYTVPYQGIIFFNDKEFSKHYEPDNDSLVFAHLAMIAEGVRNIKKAYHWSIKAFDMARDNSSKKALWLMTTTAPKYSLVNFKIEETIESYLIATALTFNTKGSYEEKLDQFIKIDEKWLIDQRPGKEWDDAEDSTTKFAIIPLIMMLMEKSLNNDEDFEKSSKLFKNTISNYIIKASDKLLWKLILELYSKIMSNEISIKKLIERGNTFGDNDRSNLNLICILGVIYLSKDPVVIIRQLINVLPTTMGIFSNISVVIEYCFTSIYKK